MTSGAPKSAASELDPSRVDQLGELARTTGEGVDTLIASLEARNWSVRREVVAVLASLGDFALPRLCHSLASDRKSETRIAATVETLVASVGDVDAALRAHAASSDPAVAADVAQILGRRRNLRSVPTLIALLNHADDNVAVAATEALGRVGGRAAVDALVKAVERDYFFRTYPAIDVLGRSGDPRSVAPLLRLLSKPQYLLEAARALGRTAAKAAAAPLCALLVSPADSTVRIAALALADLIAGHRERFGSATLVRETISREVSAASVQRLTRALTGADAAERIAACAVLGASHNEAAVPALVGMLASESELASAAAQAIKDIGDGVDAQLRAALTACDSRQRQILLPLLPRSGSTAEVVRCLDDVDRTVRALACDALAQMGDRSVVARLFPLLRESNQRVVQAAMAAIQSLGSSDNHALAIEAAHSDSPGARRAGLRILSYFGYGAAIDVFIEAMRDSDARVRDIAITGLALLEHPRVPEILIATAADASAQVRAAAMRGLGHSAVSEGVVAALRRGLHDADAWVRYYACQALGKQRAEAAALEIAALLPDPAGQVRVAAVEALSHLTGAPALDALHVAAASNEPDVLRAALIGLGMMRSDASVPRLIAACAAADAATRLVALSALRAFASPETLAVVAAAIDDKDEGVRAAAIGLLASWPGSAPTKLLIDAMRNTAVARQITHALSTPTPGRITGLLVALETADDELAPTLVSILGRVDAADQSNALLEVLRMPNAAARKAAAGMLAAIGGNEAIAALKRQSEEDASDEVRRICALLLTQ